MADSFGKKRPFIKVNPFLSNIAWRIEKIKSLITGIKPMVTRETARTANRKYYYSNLKIKEALNYNFIPVAETIKNTCEIFLKENQK